MKLKKLITAAFVAAALFVNAQTSTKEKARTTESDGPKNIIKTNPFPMLWGPIPFTNEYRLVYERAITPKSSIQITGAYIGKSPFTTIIERFSANELDEDINIKVNGFRVQALYKFYLLDNNNAPEGLYIGPGFSFATAKLGNTGSTTDYVNAYYTNLSAIGGYQFIAGKHFAFDIFAGVGLKYNRYNFNVDPNNSDFTFNRLSWVGPKFTLGFNMGYAW